MGRLIDADHLLFLLNSAIELRKKLHRNISDLDMMVDAVNNEPTAYDPDKVVEQLESELRLADKEKERCARENPLQFDSAKGYAMGLLNAIEIVKAGGADIK